MKKYRVKRGDTLESIAKHLGLTCFELRYFHNNHCELYNLIGDKITSSLKEILYQTKEDSIQQDFSNLKNETFFTLTLEPDSKNRTYGVQVSSFEDRKENNLKYTVQVQWLQRNLVRIYREKLFIDEKEPNMMVDELAVDLSAVLYPIEFSVNSAGELTRIYNYPEIKKRWIETKQKLKEYYIGDPEKKYIELSEQTLFNPDLLFLSLKKDWFLQAFFNGLYGRYNLKEKQESQRSFPIIPSIKAVEYTMESQIETLEEEAEKLIKIEFRGEVSDERSLANFGNEMDFAFQEFEQEPIAPVNGKYQVLYFLEPAYHTINSLYLECTLELEKNKKVYVTVSQIKEPEKTELSKKKE